MYYFTLELFLGILFLFFTVLGNKAPLSLGLLLGLSLCAYLLLSFVLEKYNEKGKSLFLFFVFLLILIAGKMMGNDLFHQPYRKPLIPAYDRIEKTAKLNGAFGVALSGAGPTVICFTEKGRGQKLSEALKCTFSDMTVQLLNIESKGSYVIETENSLL
jgi:hypothetical protein